MQTRVAKVNGGLAILKAVGFAQATDGTNTLFMEKVDLPVIEAAIK